MKKLLSISIAIVMSGASQLLAMEPLSPSGYRLGLFQPSSEGSGGQAGQDLGTDGVPGSLQARATDDPAVLQAKIAYVESAINKLSANSVQKDLSEQLRVAIQRSDVDLAHVVQLLAAGTDVNRRFRNGLTALYEASARGNEVVCILLIAAGADINATTYVGLTALFAAVRNGKDSIVALLIDEGARPLDGQSGICYAARCNNLPMCKKLLDHQLRTNDAIYAFLLRLKQLGKEGKLYGNILYRNFAALLLPHLNYTPRKKLLRTVDHSGQRAIDHFIHSWHHLPPHQKDIRDLLQLEFLDPDRQPKTTSDSWCSVL